MYGRICPCRISKVSKLAKVPFFLFTLYFAYRWSQSIFLFFTDWEVTLVACQKFERVNSCIFRTRFSAILYMDFVRCQSFLESWNICSLYTRVEHAQTCANRVRWPGTWQIFERLKLMCWVASFTQNHLNRTKIETLSRTLISVWTERKF